MKKTLLTTVLIFLCTTFYGVAAPNTRYGLPENIQDGNILHCFDWPLSVVTNNLESIAEAGFGAVQVSPLQRKNVASSTVWYDLYRPYDYAFQSTSGLGSADDLKTLCSEAAKYGIKVIVDVVANHVDKTTGVHDPWWDSKSEYVRSKGGSSNINYGNRYSITHDRLGDYYELNTENEEVIARAKAYIYQLHDMGVSGIRFDAAKHIELPSEGSKFWSEVTSVPDMFYYGEILGSTGGNSSTLIGEYATYMSVTDSQYSDGAAQSNGGIPTSALGSWASNSRVGPSKVVLWGESHDTYSNTPEGGGWSTNIAQNIIDRAYASMACRQGSAALYFARPATSGFNNIKIGKGTDAYKGKAIREINKFRNKMSDSSESFSYNSNKTACSITRGNGGAAIIMKTTGEVSVPNGNSNLPAGTYIDRVTGKNIFTVTASAIEGEVGPTGIAVLYEDPSEPIIEDVTDYSGDSLITVYYENSVTGWTDVYVHYWGGASETAWPGIKMKSGGNNIFVAEVPDGSNGVFNDGGKGYQTVNIEPLEDWHLYKGMSKTAKCECSDQGIFEGEIVIDPDIYTIYYDNSLSKWNDVYCYYWGPASNTWPGEKMEPVEETADLYSISLPKECSVVFNNNNKGKQSNDVTKLKHLHIYQVQSSSASKAEAVDIGEYSQNTGVETLPSDSISDFSIEVLPGAIIINAGQESIVMVSDIHGRISYNGKIFGNSTRINVNPGINIVNVNGKTRKIIVK